MDQNKNKSKIQILLLNILHKSWFTISIASTVLTMQYIILLIFYYNILPKQDLATPNQF